MDISKLNQGEKIAGAAGIVLLISLWLTWFTVNGVNGINGAGLPGGSSVGLGVDRTAWESFSITDLILFLTAVVAIGAAVIKATDASISLPIAASAVVAGLGVVGLLLVVFHLFSKPDYGAPSGINLDVSLAWGYFVGLIAVAAVAYGGYAGMQEEGTSFGEEAGRLGG